MSMTDQTPTKIELIARSLVALGPERAAAIVQTFPEEMLTDVADAMTKVPEMDPDEVAEALRWVVNGLGEKPHPSGDLRYAVEVVERAFGAEKASEVREQLNPQSKPFGFLIVGEAEVTARAIAGEPLGTLALALASIDPTDAAKLLRYFDEDAQAELHMRIATLAPVSEALYNAIEQDMRERITPLVIPEGLEEIPGLDVVVEMLGQVSKKIEKRILEQISMRNEDLAKEIREAMFVFDDVAALDNRAIQEILKAVDTNDLSLALYPANESVRERFMSNLSTRARENLAEEIEFLRNPAKSDMKAAQKRIVASVRSLEEAGTITIERGGDDDDDE